MNIPRRSLERVSVALDTQVTLLDPDHLLRSVLTPGERLQENLREITFALNQCRLVESNDDQVEKSRMKAVRYSIIIRNMTFVLCLSALGQSGISWADGEIDLVRKPEKLVEWPKDERGDPTKRYVMSVETGKGFSSQCLFEDGTAVRCTEPDRWKRPRETMLYPWVSGALRDLKFSATGGRSNETGRNIEGFNQPVRFDNDKDTWGIAVGYSGKKILRDLMNTIERQTNDDWEASVMGDKPHQKGVWWREVFVDAVALDLNVGYGRRLEQDEITGQLKHRTATTFSAVVKYEVSIEDVAAHFMAGMNRLAGGR